jgi:hypothetical protein
MIGPAIVPLIVGLLAAFVANGRRGWYTDARSAGLVPVSEQQAQAHARAA